MERSAKLDKILLTLLASDSRTEGQIKDKLTIVKLLEILKPDIQEFEFRNLRLELSNENYIEIYGEYVYITHRGKMFITREGGYKKLDELSKQDDLIRNETIKKFKYDKYSFWISIAAFLIAIASFYFSYFYSE